MTRSVSFAAAAALTIGLALNPATAGAKDLDKFAANLKNGLNGNVVGYAYAISKKGKVRRTGGGGKARIAGDGNRAYTPMTRQNVASVSKTITAVAVMQLLEKNKLTIEHKIAPYLPKHWKRGYGFTNATSLTFRQLLTHTTGLDQRFKGLSESQRKKWSNGWDGLKYIVKMGVKNKDVGKYAYKNANFALFRVIIPHLWMRAKDAPTNHISASSSGPMYMLYVGDHIFKPLNIKGASCREWGGRKHAAGYRVDAPKKPGAIWNIDQKSCGGHGHWHLSAVHLARIATHMNCANHAYIPRRKRLLSKGACFAMDVRRLGWNKSSNGSNARHKGKYWHGGALFTSKTKPRKAVYSCIMKFPKGIEAAVLINSDTKNGKSACSILLDAYEAA